MVIPPKKIYNFIIFIKLVENFIYNLQILISSFQLNIKIFVLKISKSFQ